MANGEDRMNGAVHKRDIDERTFRFALRVLKLSVALPTNTAGVVLSRQVIRAATSIGANVTEAQGSSTRRDFIRRMNIARGEAREAHYFLRLIAESGIIAPPRMDGVIQEANELVSILTAIVKRSGQHPSRSRRAVA